MMITSNIYKLEVPTRANVYLIKLENENILIDSGMPKNGKHILNACRELGVPPNRISKILLTHGDVDHMGSAIEIRKATNCEIYANVKEIPYLLKQKAYSVRKRLFKILLRVHKLKDVKPLPDHEIDGISIIPTPGHTPGHVCFVYEQCLFTGDLVATIRGEIRLMSLKFTSDWKQYIGTLKNVNVNGIKWLCVSHGEPIPLTINKWKDFIATL